jgi:hypothetical protein
MQGQVQATMGSDHSKPSKKGDLTVGVNTAGRGQAITGGGGLRNANARTRPEHARPVDESDHDFVVHALGKLLLFSKTDSALVQKVVMGMWERDCEAGARCTPLQSPQRMTHTPAAARRAALGRFTDRSFPGWQSVMAPGAWHRPHGPRTLQARF